MLELFRRSHFGNYLVLLIYTFIVRLGILLYPDKNTINYQGSLLEHWSNSYLDNALFQNIISCVLIYIQAILLNQIVVRFKLSKEATAFSGFFLVLFVSLVYGNAGLSDTLVANTFLISAIGSIFKTTKEKFATADRFTSGFMIGVATLIYVPYIVFFIFGLLAIILLKATKIKDILQYTIGFIVPYYLWQTYIYWNNGKTFNPEIFNGLGFVFNDMNMSHHLILLVQCGVLLIAVIYILTQFGNINFKKTMPTQNNISVVYWFLLFCFFSFIISKSSTVINHLTVLSIPLGILFGVKVSESKQIVSYELLHLFFVGLILVSQFKIINF